MTFDAASKPILFLLDREFEDGQIPGQRFFCRHSLLLEGALSSIEGLDAQLDVLEEEWLQAAELAEGD
ncbi:MAG: hypothetical protein DI592_21530 [Stenotrophomonas maltophilia]|nr:MAG: hypothetical protein DI592_21530 [Stenotrophomonas maltophilia]